MASSLEGPWLVPEHDSLDGRAFYAAPERLGEYILVDYVDNKRKSIR